MDLLLDRTTCICLTGTRKQYTPANEALSFVLTQICAYLVNSDTQIVTVDQLQAVLTVLTF